MLGDDVVEVIVHDTLHTVPEDGRTGYATDGQTSAWTRTDTSIRDHTPGR
ncbi:hypothetical protein [Saccharopolyspora shandongensis]